jgi:hypothetical protein
MKLHSFEFQFISGGKKHGSNTDEYLFWKRKQGGL